MTRSTFKKICYEAVRILRECAPIDTGNLRYNAIRFYMQDNKFIIHVDEEIAPYMVYTEEPWISPRWKGTKNPNEGWFKKAVEKIAQYIASVTKGEIKEIGVKNGRG